MDYTFRKTVIGRLSLIGLAITLCVISGCAGLGGDEGSANAREEAVQRYNYKGDKEVLFAEMPSITPAVVTRGGSVTQVYRFAPLSPNINKRFQVQEIVTLSGGDVIIELSRKILEKPQAVHMSTIQFSIPKDLPQGNYDLITIVGIDGSARRVTGTFSVK
jgi:hypothetical protein